MVLGRVNGMVIFLAHVSSLSVGVAAKRRMRRVGAELSLAGSRPLMSDDPTALKIQGLLLTAEWRINHPTEQCAKVLICHTSGCPSGYFTRLPLSTNLGTKRWVGGLLIPLMPYSVSTLCKNASS